MRYLALVFGLLLGGPAFSQAPLSVVQKTLTWDHSDSVYVVETLGESIHSSRLLVREDGTSFAGRALTKESTGLEWCLWLLFVENKLGPALGGLQDSPEIVVIGERIAVHYKGSGSLLLDFETSQPMRLVFIKDDVEWSITWAVPGTWDHVQIYRNGAPKATLSKVAPQELRVE